MKRIGLCILVAAFFCACDNPIAPTHAAPSSFFAVSANLPGHPLYRVCEGTTAKVGAVKDASGQPVTHYLMPADLPCEP
jgi:hypothetical protein